MIKQTLFEFSLAEVSPVMPNAPFAHVCLLVEDLDRAIADWTTILGVLDPQQVAEPVVRYEDFEGGEDRMRWATFVSDRGAEIQLIEPAEGTPLGRRLAKVGEHVHHVCFAVDDPEAAAARLRAAGIETSGSVSQDPAMPWQRWTWILPASAHGTLVEIARPYRAVAGRWQEA
jgi:methylmalonyl-CoA/ethylmalonyl-CoA epimerase